MLKKNNHPVNNALLQRPEFVFCFLALLFILYIRVTRGLDLTDEIQYYAEIKGLINTGSLFSNDLFVQQAVYIYLYPFFKVFHSFFAFQGVVLFGRLLMALLSMAVFYYTYKKLLTFNFSSVVASITALSVTFAIPYHGIFAPSYNTIAQMLWVIFILKYFDWEPGSDTVLSVLPVVVAVAHPTSAIAMSVLIFVRLAAEREFLVLRKCVLIGSISTLALMIPIFYFATLQDYLDALAFSGGYGVGTNFFSNSDQIASLLKIYALFFAGFLSSKYFRKNIFPYQLVYLVAVCAAIIFVGDARWGYSHKIAIALSCLSALAYGWSIAAITDSQYIKKIHWALFAVILYATTIGITSSNGIGQATGAFMIGLPVLLAVAIGNSQSGSVVGRSSLLNVFCLALTTVLLVLHWSYFPYRDAPWWRASQPVQTVSEFKYIRTSPERVDYIELVQENIVPVTQGKSALIASYTPGLYFILNSYPETCMIYTHSITSEKSKKILLKCLEDKAPGLFIHTFDKKGLNKSTASLLDLLEKEFQRRQFQCSTSVIEFETSSVISREPKNYVICSLQENTGR